MARKPAKTDNLVDPKDKKLFIEMRDHWKGLDDRVKAAEKKAKAARDDRRLYQNDAVTAGFSVRMFEDSLQMATPQGEAEFKAEIANRLLAAAYSDADIGDQLSLFLDNNRTPAVDRAYKEGQTRAMENKTLECRYDPDTEQYRAFAEGYHAEQERQVKAGIGKLDAKAGNGKGAKGAPSKGKKAAKADKVPGRRGRPPGKVKDDAPPRKPSAAPATRASMAAARKNGDAAPDSYFSKSTEPAGNA